MATLTTADLVDGLLVIPGVDPRTGEPITADEALLAEEMAQDGVSPIDFGVGWVSAVSGILGPADG